MAEDKNEDRAMKVGEVPPGEPSLEYMRWLMDRHDSWRSSIANRASLVLSADALLLAGQTFLLDRLVGKPHFPSFWLHWVLLGAIAAVFVLLLLSLAQATTGIANVWRTSRAMLGETMPSRMYFHPSDAIRECQSLEQFEASYRHVQAPDVHRAAWAELWSLVNMHHRRYQNLRTSIQLLVISLPFYLVSLGLFLAMTAAGLLGAVSNAGN